MLKTENFIREKHTLNLPRGEWLELRKTGIGGSDSGALAGLNKYSSPLNVYADKKNLSREKEQTEIMKFGNTLENIVAKEFETITGKKVRNLNYFLRSKNNSILTANIDRLVVGENAILECKTYGGFSNFKGDTINDIPLSYYYQIQHYLAVTGADKCYLAVLIRGNQFKYYTILRNQKDIDIISNNATFFWKNYILKNIEPPSTGSENENELIDNLYPEAEEKIINYPKTEKLNTYFELKLKISTLKKEIKPLDEEAESIEQEIKLFLKEKEEAENEKAIITWKNKERRTFDSKKLQLEQPEIFSKYSITKQDRVFKIKEIIGEINNV